MKKAETSSRDNRCRTARTPEARENQLISLATDLAEKQLREGTASSQVIAHYLKLGSSRERLEKEIMKRQIKNLEAKTEAIEAAKHQDELYAKAIDALRMYAVGGSESDD